MTALAVLLVAAVLVFAIVRPRGLHENVVAIPAAAIALATGLVTIGEAQHVARQLGPTIGFLAAVLVLAHLADALGVFRWLAGLLTVGSQGSPTRLLALVFVVASLTTAALSLDATVVLLTPAIIATARTLRVPPRPVSYASAHLSNTASLLMPVSNLTNLLAFSAVGVSFLRFTALMALPWFVAIAVEFAVFRLFFARDLAPATPRPVPQESAPDTDSAPGPPVLALVILGATLIGFGVSGLIGLAPAWVAVIGAAALAIPAMSRGRTHPRRILVEAAPGFLLFVLALGIVVAGVTAGPIGRALADHVPRGTGYLELLAMAAGAAVLANLVNNLPAILMLVAALGTGAPTGLVLAALIGVNIGPNLTYIGSLATMLWRRVVERRGSPADLKTFTALGLLTTPAALIAAVTALWAVL